MVLALLFFQLSGPNGPRFHTEDVGSPGSRDPPDCQRGERDQLADLSMKLAADQVISALELDQLPAGTSVDFVVLGSLTTGQAFLAFDSLTLIPNGAATRTDRLD